MTPTPKPLSPSAAVAAAAPAPATVLVVDDEPEIRQFLDISLRAQGYRVVACAGGRAALEELPLQAPDVVILDLGLPDLDGAQVLARIRQVSEVPVIVLTVRADEAQKVTLLDAGANDYVTKPFGIQELMARLRQVLRHRAQPREEAPVFDDDTLRIDLVNLSVSLQGEPVALTRKELALLTVLAREPGRLISHGRLLREVWGPTHEEDVHYLRIVVARLRKKLGDDALHPRYLITEPGVGLRFGPEHP
ncbi:MAG: Transcriptional regulatory protein KdpE [Paracidovorax wautersii]|uniref:Transcriptional regulatory protein KdpE n=1 Tax=Paracidovorax wautersii TaxID=1177982 RepID=A0A7V8FNB7_9BURK|nr:MAG: Transcriptional regulatory protein KdpE [Paracidovorax wautersii]